MQLIWGHAWWFRMQTFVSDSFSENSSRNNNDRAIFDVSTAVQVWNHAKIKSDQMKSLKHSIYFLFILFLEPHAQPCKIKQSFAWTELCGILWRFSAPSSKLELLCCWWRACVGRRTHYFIGSAQEDTMIYFDKPGVFWCASSRVSGSCVIRCVKCRRWLPEATNQWSGVWENMWLCRLFFFYFLII